MHLLQSLLTYLNSVSPANPKAAQFYQHDTQAYNKFLKNILIEPIVRSLRIMFAKTNYQLGNSHEGSTVLVML